MRHSAEYDGLFPEPRPVMLRACLRGEMGRVLAAGPDSALALIGDFCFLAGRPDRGLLRRARVPLLVPLTEGWAELIRRELGERARPFTRYATREEPERFDRERLARMAEALPEGVRLAPIGEEWYPALMARSWSRDLCGNFRDGADFARRGLGVVALRAGEPVAGAASYAVCGNGIEVEIDTAPRFRRRGLARACGAKLILDCLDRGLFPGWDAHDRRSLALAEQLGYRLDRPYPAFWVEEWAKGD